MHAKTVDLLPRRQTTAREGLAIGKLRRLETHCAVTGAGHILPLSLETSFGFVEKGAAFANAILTVGLTNIAHFPFRMEDSPAPLGRLADIRFDNR